MGHFEKLTPEQIQGADYTLSLLCTLPDFKGICLDIIHVLLEDARGEYHKRRADAPRNWAFNKNCPECTSRVDVTRDERGRIVAQCCWCGWNAVRHETGEWEITHGRFHKGGSAGGE